MPTQPTTGAETPEDLAEDFNVAETGETLEEWQHEPAAPVDVIVTHPVTTRTLPARTIITDQVPLDTQAARRLVPELRTRAHVLICPRGGDAVIGAATLTTGSGFLLKADQTFGMESTDALYALGVAPGVIMHVIAQIREG